MTYRREVEVTETQPGPTVIQERIVQPPPATVVHERIVEPPVVRRYYSSPGSIVGRWVVFIFGMIELLIGLRIILLLVAARESNNLVSAIYGVSEIFVAPFRGILRIGEVQTGRTELDVSAIVALVGWFVIELIVLALVRVFRPTATA
ncbi:MAG: YggT family protein [Candidatus Limnocylindrales bacterium]